jgi:formamidopyrimidine-DNA glycosylase
VPELPELEQVRRYLEANCLGKTLTGAIVNQPACVNLEPEAYARCLQGAVIEHVWRRGKLVLLDLSNAVSLIVHLALGGEVLLKDSPGHDPARTQIILTFADGSALHFHQLVLGNVHVFPTYHLATTRLGKLGPDALLDLPSAEGLQAIYGARGKPIKVLLVDQSLLCGIGNFYADEILFHAGLHPARRGKTLEGADFARLRSAIEQVLAAALHAQEPGAAPFEPQVYGRAGESCRVCGATIEGFRLANRSAHNCPDCQPSEADDPPRSRLDKRRGRRVG